MFDKRLTVSLFDFKLQELSPLEKHPFSKLKVNIDDASCKKKEKEESEEEEMEEEEDKIEVKKKIVKIIGVKSEEEEKESSESDEDDSDSGDASMSSYEKMIEKKQAERMAFLKSLQIDKVKADFHEAVTTVKNKRLRVNRKYKEPEEASSPPLRKSRRIANLSASNDLSEDALYQKSVHPPKRRPYLNLSSTFSRIIKSSAAGVQKQEIKEIPAELPYKTALLFDESFEDYCKNLDFQTPRTEFKLFSYDKSVVKNLTLPESNIAKVTPARITSVAWHPAPENLIFAAGDNCGNLGIWKVNSESDPFVFKNHNKGTTNVMFNPFNSNHLMSSSYEGTLRRGDMSKHVFSEVYNVSEKSCCTYFDVLSETTYLVAQKNGQVALVDDRVEGKRSQKTHTCHDYSIQTVNVHPVNRSVFVTAENKGPIRLWDLRKLQKQPIADICHHKSCVSSAYFSPITGNSILATSHDDTISIFDSTNLTENIKLKRSLRHNNQSGIMLSVFRAMWLPNSEEAFVVGSLNPDRRIELYDKDMNIYYVIKHENFCTITFMNIFHPGRPALVGGNLNGKVVVFTPR